MRSILITLVLLSSSSHAWQAAPAVAPAKTARIPALQRIAVIGASVSDGMNLSADVGAKTVFSDIVGAALKSEHAKLVQESNAWFFQDPSKFSQREIDAVKAKDPTLVIGVDYLFWFAYGIFPSEQARLDLFDAGLASLADFQCPVLVGDIPDMSLATHGYSNLVQGPLISPQQVPSQDSQQKINERLYAWAADHHNVTVVPLAALTAKLQSDQEIVVHGNTWPKGAMKTLLQQDLLHTTLEGSIAVWLQAQASFVEAHPEVPAESFEWDAKTISKSVYASKESERKAKAETAARRAAREKEKEKESTPPAPAPAPGEKKAGESREKPRDFVFGACVFERRCA